MNDVLARAACDFENDASHRQDIAKDIENEVAITQCCRGVLAVIGHLPHTFDLACGEEPVADGRKIHEPSDPNASDHRGPGIWRKSCSRGLSRSALSPPLQERRIWL